MPGNGHARIGFPGIALIIGLCIFAVQQGSAVLNDQPSWVAGVVWFLVAIIAIFSWNLADAQGSTLPVSVLRPGTGCHRVPPPDAVGAGCCEHDAAGAAPLSPWGRPPLPKSRWLPRRSRTLGPRCTRPRQDDSYCQGPGLGATWHPCAPSPFECRKVANCRHAGPSSWREKDRHIIPFGSGDAGV